ncbi:MAG: His/Gly/Thr/Pro-type tRNA ligase C-terminal domain-containing protein [Candidatus Moranbacteria bacterium]|jgi:prolyl-tRNA synthetase|nr:His/Gly/Thr/Pro-type tRNA ligase C-terminal domain-containing protein [Candidatus Moranbacteria bacterium]MDD5652049.1 His/Gly/Thr/Pro-type tRNA ligase C-terminal domain-containing protein [Candidatus Moranbacteria bacterium]MDX9855360.1 aminoacyl--tRNA ligase-related protein [Candidatus Moranbacteria bacterium]
MKQSKLFTKTQKFAPKDEVSKNAQLLIRAGFVHKEMAGVYSFLPLGLRVIEKIKNIIREELNAIGAVEMEMTALQKSETWEKTGRWDDKIVDDWFKTNLKNGTELGLAFTHEEPLTNIMKSYISSHKDLPKYAYQFQTKFRNELRAKSGVLRGREFLMKDLYNFSLNKKQHEEFYEKMKEVYMRIFTRIGIGDRTFLTMSSGGSFSKYSFEFQTVTDAGEDIIVLDKEKRVSINKSDFSEELLKDFGIDKDKMNFKEVKAAEVGDIYTLGEKYSKALGLTYKDENGEEKNVYMGSYGIGVPRIMGVVTEIFNDEKGIIWPESVAPFRVHLISLNKNEEAEKIYNDLTGKGVEVFYDDRNARPGEKFADSDLIGIPYRVVVSEKSLEKGGVEVKKRDREESKIVKVEELLKNFA